MLTVSNIESSSSGSKYYTQGSYYTESVTALQVEGKLSETLDINKDDINETSLESLLSGVIPTTGEKLGVMRKGELQHRPGMDLTFSAPKSVSILAYLGKDNDLLTAHDFAVKEAFSYIENNAIGYRLYNKDTEKYDFIKGGEIMGALFRHFDSRSHDPQMHSHCVVPNMVKCHDGKYRSLDNRMIYDVKRVAGTIYQSSLAKQVQDLGYNVEKHKDGMFEISGVSDDLKKLFSERSETILDIAKQTGVTDTKGLLKIQKATRGTKENITFAELQKQAENKLSSVNMKISDITNLSNNLKNNHIALNETEKQAHLDKSFKNTLDSITERSFVFTKNEFLNKIIPLTYGKISPSETLQYIENKIQTKELILSLETRPNTQITYMTTQKSISLEQECFDHFEKGLNQGKKLLDKNVIREKLATSTLVPGQKDAVETIISSKHRVVTVQGSAGTGKTYMLNNAVEHLHNNGQNVIALATTHQAKSLLGEETGLDAMTLSSFILSNKKALTDETALTESQNQYKNTVLVIDECSMIGTEQMNDLLNLSNKLELTRVVLVGDKQQLQAVNAGNPFTQLQKDPRMEIAKMTEIQRQKNETSLTAVKSMLSGDIKKSLEHVNLIEVSNNDPNVAMTSDEKVLSLADTAIKAYINLPQDKYNAIVTTMNIHKDIVNLKLRQHLKENNILTGKEYKQEVLKDSSLTNADKEIVGNYQKGDVLKITRKVNNNSTFKGLKVSSLGKVTSYNKKDNLLTVDFEGKEITFNPQNDKNSSVYNVNKSSSLHIQKGEQILFTTRNTDHNIMSKASGKISNITNQKIFISMADGRNLSFKKNDQVLKSLDYFYSATGHSLQGETVDNIVSILPSKGKLTNQQSGYVHLSRTRDSITVITDDKEELIRSIENNDGEKLSSLDMIDHKAILEKLEKAKPDLSHVDKFLSKSKVQEVGSKDDIIHEKVYSNSSQIRSKYYQLKRFNKNVRDEFQLKGLLTGRTHNVETLRELAFQDKQKSNIGSYKLDHILTIKHDLKDQNIRSHALFKVLETNPKNNTLKVECNRYIDDSHTRKEKHIMDINLKEIDPKNISIYKSENLPIQKGELLKMTLDNGKEISLKMETINHKSGKIKAINSQGKTIYIPKNARLEYDYLGNKTTENQNMEDKTRSFILSQAHLKELKNEKDKHLFKSVAQSYVANILNNKDVDILTDNLNSKHKINSEIRKELMINDILKGYERVLGTRKLEVKNGEKLIINKDIKSDQIHLEKGSELEVKSLKSDSIILETSTKELLKFKRTNEILDNLSYNYAKTSLDIQTDKQLNKTVITNISNNDVNQVSSREFISALSKYDKVNIITENAQALDKELSNRFDKNVSLPVVKVDQNELKSVANTPTKTIENKPTELSNKPQTKSIVL